VPASLTIGKDWISWARSNIDSILIAFDLDGTLVDEDGHIKHSDLEIITEVHRRGAKITLATGRTYKSARPFISQLEIEIPIILCNGALILDPMQRAVLYERKIPTEIAMVVLMKSVQHKMEPIIYTDGVNGYPCVNAVTRSMKDFLLLEEVRRAELNALEEIVQNDSPAKIQVIGNSGGLCPLQPVI
jgi:HAD superfamily hydrolase (TIGR01484 family)